MRIRYAAAMAAGILAIAAAFFLCPEDGRSILSHRPVWILLGFSVFAGALACAFVDRPGKTMLERAGEVLDAIREMGQRRWPGAIVCEEDGKCLFVSAKSLGESLGDSVEPEIFAVWKPAERDEIASMLKKSLFSWSEEDEAWLLTDRFLPRGVRSVRLIESPEGHIFILDYIDDNEK